MKICITSSSASEQKEHESLAPEMRATLKPEKNAYATVTSNNKNPILRATGKFVPTPRVSPNVDQTTIDVKHGSASERPETEGQRETSEIEPPSKWKELMM